MVTPFPSPQLSIITVCRNEASRIRGTIDSITQQSDSAAEWIVIDGHSTDGTLEMLELHRARISKLISEPDQGLYDAMNKGIQAARGKYILFLNAGDRLAHKNVVSVFQKESFTAEIIVGDIRVIMADGREFFRTSLEKPLDQNLLYWRSLPHQATFVKKELFDKFGVYDLSFKIIADWEFFARVIVRHHIPPVAWSHCVSVYANNGVSANLGNRLQLRQERQRIRQLHFPLHYRWRRNFNEGWGGLIHRIRTQIRTNPTT